jgi:hypothetical protein
MGKAKMRIWFFKEDFATPNILAFPSSLSYKLVELPK